MPSRHKLNDLTGSCPGTSLLLLIAKWNLPQLLQRLDDLLPLWLAEHAHLLSLQPEHCIVAAYPAEQEPNAGQQIPLLQHLQHFLNAWRLCLQGFDLAAAL